MSPFRRFQKYVVIPHFEDVLETHQLTNYPAKGPLLAKVTGALWQSGIVQPLAQRNNVNQNDIDKFKKSKVFKQQADQEITNILGQFNTDSNSVHQFENAMVEEVSNALAQLDTEGREFLE